MVPVDKWNLPQTLLLLIEHTWKNIGNPTRHMYAGSIVGLKRKKKWLSGLRSYGLLHCIKAYGTYFL